MTWNPEPAPTETWSCDLGVRNKIVTEVPEKAPVTMTVFTSPVEDVLVLSPPAGSVTPDKKRSNSVGEMKWGFVIRLERFEKWLSRVNSTPVG